MENRIKECQGDLFADRTSSATMCANQLRLWFAAMAQTYVLICPRRIGLKRTQLAKATCNSIRLACSRSTPWSASARRRVELAMASGCPYQAEFRQARILLTATAGR